MVKAIILAGGYGTRLRPFTFSTPKPMIEFINKPIIVHQLEALKRVNVDEIIIAVNYKWKDLKKGLKPIADQMNIRLYFSVENLHNPLGTAGPIALAAPLIGDSSFFVLNSDIICDFPFEELLQFHEKHGKEGTILTTRVTEPSKYGVIVGEDLGRIEKFVEKPGYFISDRINAGIYLFNNSVLRRLLPVPSSIEKEIFPEMAKDQTLCSMSIKGFWMDIGNPSDFLLGSKLFLQHNNITSVIGENSTIGEGCELNENVVIGSNCIVGKFVRLKNCTLLNDVIIGEGCTIENSVIGWRSKIEREVSVLNSHLGEDVKVKKGCHLTSCSILPHKEVAISVSSKIVM